MRDEGRQMLVDVITDTILEGGERIVEATDRGFTATVEAIDEFIIELINRRNALVIAAQQPCNDPDCPVHGKAARETDNPNLN